MKPYYDVDGITIYHGDCREVPFDADVMVTDPPYGMAYVSSHTIRKRPVVGDKSSALRDEVLAAWNPRPAVVFGTWRVQRPLGTRQVVTWFKRTTGPGMGDLTLPWGCATEEVYIIGTGWKGRRGPNLVTTAEQRGGTAGLAALLGHPTPKPVALIEHFLVRSPDGTVLDRELYTC